MRKPKVIIFLLSNLSVMRGGVVWTRNLLENFAQIADMDFIVVSIGPSEVRAANEGFVKSVGFGHIFVPVRGVIHYGRRTRFERLATVARNLLNALRDKYYFLGEREARNQKPVDSEVMEIISEERPDLIIMNSIWSAVWVPSVLSCEITRCLITTDNDVVFHRAFRSQCGPLGKDKGLGLKRWVVRHGNWIANRRFRRYANFIYRQCNGIVALTRADLPSGLPSNIVQTILPPLLQESTLRWNYHASRCVFFVGNVTHFPNRLAVEWICSQLAPELYRIDDTVRINIIGATADQVRSEWRLLTINFLGEANKEEVIRHMTTDDLFIAPIANNFGAKLKLAECASYGMPFLATGSAMSGLPFLTFVPQFDLDKPGAAARLIVEYVNRPEALTNLSHSIAEQMRQARAEQFMAWSNFLKRLMVAK